MHMGNPRIKWPRNTVFFINVKFQNPSSFPLESLLEKTGNSGNFWATSAVFSPLFLPPPTVPLLSASGI